MDIVEKLMKDIGKICAKIFVNKEEKCSEKINIDQMDSVDIFKIVLNKSFHEGDYNKAENLIFNELENNNSPEVYEVAMEFYNELLKKSDEHLNRSDFTRNEIYQGLKDIQKFRAS